MGHGEAGAPCSRLELAMCLPRSHVVALALLRPFCCLLEQPVAQWSCGTKGRLPDTLLCEAERLLLDIQDADILHWSVSSRKATAGLMSI